MAERNLDVPDKILAARRLQYFQKLQNGWIRRPNYAGGRN